MGCNSSSIQTVETTIISQNSNSNYNKQQFRESKNVKFDENFISWMKLIETLQSKTNIKDYVLSRKRESFSTLNELKDFLLKSPANTEVEKAWVVYLWMTHNIDYNFSGYLKGSYGGVEPDSVFKTGLSVCSGYATLSQNLFDVFNIKNITISGYSKGYGYKIGQKFDETDHEWNAVFIQNKWQFIESTWVK
jgi:transglutaminase/protease-like cytokinesis protein 3